jgi:hypothetical protein
MSTNMHSYFLLEVFKARAIVLLCHAIRHTVGCFVVGWMSGLLWVLYFLMLPHLKLCKRAFL